MQQLDHLWKLVSAASTVRDLAQETKTHEFVVTQPITCYVHTEHAHLVLHRWDKPQIRMTLRLQAAFAWRILTEQDAAGVYLVAKRRNVIGTLASLHCDLYIPHTTQLILRLEATSIELSQLNGTLHIPPSTAQGTITLQPNQREDTER